MRVLVVDDSRVMRQIVIRTLRQAGYDWWEISEAADGRAAYEAVLADPPALVLSDWNMPEMTGMELLQSLRAANVDVPFAFVTSEGSAEMRAQAERFGAELPGAGTAGGYQTPACYSLTPREDQVGMLVCRGLSNKDVGARLGLSVNTVETHLKSIYRKCGVDSRTALAHRLAGGSPATP